METKALALFIHAQLPSLEGGVGWSCVRPAPEHRFSRSVDDQSGAVMRVSDPKGASADYGATLANAVSASARQITLKGSVNALFFIDVYNKADKNILGTGWKKSPAKTEGVTFDFPAQAVGRVDLFTWFPLESTSSVHLL